MVSIKECEELEVTELASTSFEVKRDGDYLVIESKDIPKKWKQALFTFDGRTYLLKKKK